MSDWKGGGMPDVQRVQASRLEPGMQVRRLDLPVVLLYTIVGLSTEDVHNPEIGQVLTYVRADCLHDHDQTTRPHYWLPNDWVTIHNP